jgi:UDPglucose 6-dehydrogenase
MNVQGNGHLADALRHELTGWDFYTKCPGLTFIAEDIVDHQDDRALDVVVTLFDLALEMDYSTIVIVSQVPPGFTRKLAEKTTKAKVFYQADTIIVRSALQRLIHPEQFIIGCPNTEPLPLAYQMYLAAHKCPVWQMSYESAELAKCAINYALAKQIEMARELEEVADKIGASYDSVRIVLHGDSRIGPHAYLQPGELNQHLLRDVVTISRLLEGEDR